MGSSLLGFLHRTTGSFTAKKKSSILQFLRLRLSWLSVIKMHQANRPLIAHIMSKKRCNIYIRAGSFTNKYRWVSWKRWRHFVILQNLKEVGAWKTYSWIIGQLSSIIGATLRELHDTKTLAEMLSENIESLYPSIEHVKNWQILESSVANTVEIAIVTEAGNNQYCVPNQLYFFH